ncbi:Mediator of RNA polymerase II transcription subunit 31 [Golovinomyces cichoracearum]|uniref:Mediator of RNA polymerase II transcription subunit 31 n=1 Tax=Golovinomyces cichoracearum TaxID=62708 RepID=A0A420IZF5_9PEZI|nr:Mediator of RNA polymerase II transcription subunit 31 [Golovinomyces cichoracearum]
MSGNQTPPNIPTLKTCSEIAEPKYGGFTRFEIELEFVQALASPLYLNHLASQKYFENPDFIAYLAYLQYWAHPLYIKYLIYPGPTLKNLELLQQDRFRVDILSPEIVKMMVEEGIKKGAQGPGTNRAN